MSTQELDSENRIVLPEGRPGIKSVDFIFPIFMLTEVPHIL